MAGLPAASKKGGMCSAMPNVCKTPAPPGPPVPIPYPNISQINTATKTVSKVLIEHKETVVETSEIPSSMGDEAGVAGGLKSGVHGKTTRMKEYSTKVIAGGKKIVPATAGTDQNDMNAQGKVVAVAQMKVLVAM